MIKRIKNNKSLLFLCFLGMFGFAVGLFANYRELWLSANGIGPASIGRVISLASIITVLVFTFFSLKYPYHKLKTGLSITLLLKMITSTMLICLNNKGFVMPIKFIIFFDIAFEEIIFGSLYPLIMQINKSDLIYTKKNVVESVSSKFGFLLASFLLSKTIGSFAINYNSCLLMSVICIFLAFILFLNISEIDSKNDNNDINLKDFFDYLKDNKILLFFLVVNAFGSMVWASIVGMRLLSLTKIMGVNTKLASYLVLGLGIISNALAIIIVKYFKLKNDYINLFIKYGARVILYLLIFILNTKRMLFITFIYLLLLDIPYGFIFSSYFVNRIKEEYSMVFATIKYCFELIGTSIGIYICGLTFNMSIKYIGLITFILASIHYIMANILVSKKNMLKG